MRFSQACIGALLVGLAVGAPRHQPVKRRSTSPSDVQILNYALTLEHLEDAFYRQGLAAFSSSDFYAAGFDTNIRYELQIIGADETQHVAFLTAAIQAVNATAVPECSYNFSITSVASFINTALLLEGIGVSAYLGAAADIMASEYLTAAASILTVEARHSAYLRQQLDQTPFAQPFDTSLDYSQVSSLAANFILACPGDNMNISSLPISIFPPLSVACTNSSIVSGTILQLEPPDINQNVTRVYAAFLTVAGTVFQNVSQDSQGYLDVVVPAGINGQAYLVLTADNSSVTDDNTLAGPAVINVENY